MSFLEQMQETAFNKRSEVSECFSILAVPLRATEQFQGLGVLGSGPYIGDRNFRVQTLGL